MERKNSKQGFTLLELLVVVLIIGILAAIALPQYQMAVGRAKFSTIKNLTRSVAEAKSRYLLTQSTYPTSFTDLDIDLQIKNEYSNHGYWFKFTTSNNITCMIWTFETNTNVACGTKILGKNIHYYVANNASPKSCLVYSEDDNDLANKLCQQETGKTNGTCTNDGGGQYCIYAY